MLLNPAVSSARQGGNVVLTGFMGTGKSTVGRLVAEALGYTFVDTDAVIEQRHGSIAEIFSSAGEVHFRALEQALATELAARSQSVIATGGKLMLDPANHVALARTGQVFCLSASVDSILKRLSTDDGATRPLLQGADPAERVRTLLAERAEGYAQFEQIDTESKSPLEVSAAVLAALAESLT